MLPELRMCNLEVIAAAVVYMVYDTYSLRL